MNDILAQLVEIFEQKATGRYGLSDVDQLQHALQSATLAEEAGRSASFVVAALLHDVGHMIHALGEDPASVGIDDSHEERAAAWLSPHFPPEVTEPIRLHVPAKRYLCAIEPDYFGRLSEDSVRSLALQGGPMSGAELATFAGLPFAEDAVLLRRIDDRAKDPTRVSPPFRHFLPLVDLVRTPAHAAHG